MSVSDNDSDSYDSLSLSNHSNTNTFYPFCNDIITNTADISINKIELGMTLEDDYSYQYHKQEKKLNTKRLCKILNTNLNIANIQDKLGLSMDDIVNTFLENETT